MVVEFAAGEEGQSIIEFMLLLPLMIGLTVMMIRINSAVNVSIVNQKYSRLASHFLTFNSPYFPATGSGSSEKNQRRPGMHRLTTGIADNVIGAGSRRPKAVEVFVARNRTLASSASNAAGSEPDSRANVRVRTTVTLCGFSHTLSDGKPHYESESLAKLGVGTSANAGDIFRYCSGAGRQDHNQ